HHHACARYTGGTDRCECSYQGDGKDLAEDEFYPKILCDEHNGNPLVNRRTVHVDGRTKRQNEAACFLRHIQVLLSIFHCDSQCLRITAYATGSISRSIKSSST